MSKKQNQQSSSKKGFAPFRWISRAFMGASRQYAEETLQQQEENRINDVEEIVSPGRQLVRNFMERKLAVFALCVVIARQADRWLAHWSLADATLAYPVDPLTATDVVAGLLRDRAAPRPAVRR